ncbi:MAG: hypothetical protein PVI57_06600 [Gemmatimonadota bacterium]
MPFLLALTLGGCGDRGREAVPGALFRDSAGAAIAESARAVWDAEPGRRWSIDTLPELDLTRTGTGRLHEFYRVVGAVFLSDGRIVVGDDGSKQIRAYSRHGESLASVGREGEGPGEYGRIMGLIALTGDSIGVFSWPDRLTVLAPDLAFARTTRLGDQARRPRQLANGDLVALRVFPSVVEYEGRGGMIREDVPMVRLSPDGTVEDTLWVGPGFEEYMFASEESSGAMRPLFGKGLSFDARGSTIVVGTADAMAYDVLDPAGRVRRIVRVLPYDLSLDPSEVQAERASYLAGDPPAFYREAVASLPAPDRRPAYSDLRIDAEGFVWAGAHRSRAELNEPRHWEVFAPDGTWMGALHTPPRFELLEVGTDRLLGVRADELDVEHVQVLGLERGTARGGR